MLDELDHIDAGEEASSRALDKKARSERARLGAAKSKSAGVQLGNTRNLRDAQLRGAATVKRTAQRNFDNFDELEVEAIREGATTGPRIAAWLNDRGHRTPSDGTWTEGNVYQTRRKSRARKAAVTAPPAAPPKPPIVDNDRRLTTEGKERIGTAMKLMGMEWGVFADLLEALGFKRLDPSLGLANHRGTRLRPELYEKLRIWVEKTEA